MSNPLQTVLIGCGAALLLWSAVAHSQRPAGEGVLARFNGGQIDVADLRAAIANKDFHTRRRLATPDGRKGLLRDLVNYELLVLEAERRGYASHPAVIDAKRSAAINGMLASDLRVDPASIPRADVGREFETRLALGEKPAKPPRLSAVEGALREELAKRRFEWARNELVKRLREKYKPEIFAELIDAVTFGPEGPKDQPYGFPAAPPDPRAAPRIVESDGI